MSRNSSSSISVKSRRTADHRDEIVAATLVGMVLVLLGYASGIAGGSGAAQASGSSAPNAVAVQPSLTSSGPAPVIVQATGGPGDGSGYGGGYGGGYGSGYTGGGGAAPGAGGGSGGTSGTGPSHSAVPSSGSSDPVIVGSPGASPSAGPSGSSSPGAACDQPLCLGSGLLSGLLPCPSASSAAGLLTGGSAGLGGLLSGVTTTVGSVAGGLLGTCASATPTPSAP